MLCQRCKNNSAVVEYIEEVNGNRFKINLCADCYAELCSSRSSITSDIWTELFVSNRKTRSCPKCGTTYAEYERDGLLGCPECYQVFKDELLPSIRKIQGGDTHIGKYGIRGDERGLNVQLIELKAELEKAIRDKRFSDADKIHKKITAIKNSLKGD